jgi:capsular polysaccharide biosynthesis protein
MDLIEFIGVIRGWKWLVLAVIVVVTSYTVFSSARTPASYSAEATVVAGLSQITSSSTLGISMAQSGERISGTYAELVNAQPVIEKALEKAGLDWSIASLRPLVSATTTKNTPVMRIKVVDSDADRAKLLANSVSDAFVEYIKDVSKTSILEAQAETIKQLNDVNKELAALTASSPGDAGLIRAVQDRRDSILKEYQSLLDQRSHAGDVRVVDPAETVSQTGMPPSQRVTIGFVISLVAGIVLAFIAEAVRKSVRQPAGE